MRSKSISLAKGALSLFCVWVLIVIAAVSAVPAVAFFTREGAQLPGEIAAGARELGFAIRGEYTEMSEYKSRAVDLLDRLYGETLDGKSSRADDYYGVLQDRDVLYRCEYRHVNGVDKLTNAEEWDGSDPWTGDFNYFLSLEKGEVRIWKDGGVIYDSTDPFAPPYTFSLSGFLGSLADAPEAKRITVRFMVRSHSTEPTNVPSAVIGETQSYANRMIIMLAVCLAAAAVVVLLIVFAFAFRRHRRAFVRRLGALLGRVWFEVKFVFAAIGVDLCLLLLRQNYAGRVLAVLVGLLLAFLLLTDLRCNRSLWRSSAVRSLLRAVRGGKSAFSARVMRMFIAAAVLLVLTVLGGGSFFALLIWERASFPALLAAVFALLSFLGILAAYGALLRADLRETERLLAQISGLYRGDLNAVRAPDQRSPLYVPMMQLNMIRDGIRFTVEQGAQSERTKVELITNVSHDIKTPLTSIISYVDLLRAEPDLPAQAAEYVSVIGQKADRLKHMVQDIFDISKAATGNLPLHIERIAMDKLLRQTLGEMESVVSDGRLIWRVQIPEEPCEILADGQKLYRVFQNLIRNAAQYALTGSRVYLTLARGDSRVTVQIQNVTEKEIELDGERLTARFVRGDGSREGSGSGLGLSIAKSFTESLGGTFRVRVLGNLFTAEVTFPLAPPVSETH